MNIDRDELEKALEHERTFILEAEYQLVLEAARAHLATLPEKPKVTLVAMIENCRASKADYPSINLALTATIDVLRAVEEFRKAWIEAGSKSVLDYGWRIYVDAAGKLFEKLPKP